MTNTVLTAPPINSELSGVLPEIQNQGIFAALDSLTDEQVLAMTERFCAHNYHPLPIVVRRAEGARVWDEGGREYLDMVGSYSALAHGHLNPAIVTALQQQLKRLTLTSRAVYTAELALFLAALCEYAGAEMAVPMNTGAEAVETAIKIARKWAYTVKGVERDQAEIIVADQNFHGRTTTIVGFSSEPQYRELFGPYGPGFIRVPFGDASALEAAITPNTAAVLMEPVQAEAGILFPPTGYLTEVRRICTRHNTLLIWDEIQTGFARTGRRFAWQWEPGAEPDMMTLGKALGGGVYPVSAVVGTRATIGTLVPGDHGSTFGGNPLACVVGLAALSELVRGRLDQRAEEMGDLLRGGLRTIAASDPRIADVRGRGLLVGLEFHRSAGPAARLIPDFLAEGVLTKDTHAQTLRFAPPLTIEPSDVDDAITRIGAALRRSR